MISSHDTIIIMIIIKYVLLPGGSDPDTQGEKQGFCLDLP